MKRLADWKPRLIAYLAAKAPLVIEPGVHDCALFPAGAVEAMTGVDLAAPYRGRYTTFAGGRRVLRRDGYADHMALIAAHLPEAHVSTALTGDIAILPTEDGPAVGVVGDGGVAYVLAPSGGLALCPMAPVQRLFKVV